MLTVGELFAGTGMFSLGLERAGMRVLWQVENDPWLRDVLAAHFPNAERFADVHEVGAHNLAPVDVICGGFPCQPISQAGRRRGRHDPRWLWPEFARVVRVLRPRYVLVENVDALLRPYRCPEGCGGYLPALVEDVAADLAAMGYVGEWASIRASDVGAPHERERVWIVAQLADPDGERRIHGEARLDATEGRVDALGDAAAGGGDELAHPEGQCGQVRAAEGGRPGRPTEALAHAAGGRGEWRRAGTDDTRVAGPLGVSARPDEGGRAGGLPQSRLDRGADGHTDRLDGYRWPARPGESQAGWEPPRTVVGAKNRTRRLKAIGNALVPQIAEMIGRRIVEYEERNRRAPSSEASR